MSATKSSSALRVSLGPVSVSGRPARIRQGLREWRGSLGRGERLADLLRRVLPAQARGPRT